MSETIDLTQVSIEGLDGEIGIDDLEMILSVPSKVFIWGPPGVGKTWGARSSLMNAGIPEDKIIQLNLYEDITVQEIQGHFVPQEDGSFKWQHGPVARALLGGALILNEVQRAPASVQDFLLGVMDAAEVMQIDSMGGRIKAHEEFRVVATSNTGPGDLDDALRDRFDAFLHIEKPASAVIKDLEAGYEGLGRFILASYKDPERAVSPRTGLSFLKFYPIVIEDEEKAAKWSFMDRSSEFMMAIKALRNPPSPAVPPHIPQPDMSAVSSSPSGSGEDFILEMTANGNVTIREPAA